MGETIEKRELLKKVGEVFNRKNTVAVLKLNGFKRHGCSASHGIFVTEGWTEVAVAMKRNKPDFSAMRAAVHNTMESRIATVNHLIDIFHLSTSGMKRIFNFFELVFKNILKYVTHKIIMKE